MARSLTSSRTLRFIATATAGLLAAATAAGVATAAPGSSPRVALHVDQSALVTGRVIVRGLPGADTSTVATAVTRAGGAVRDDLPIVDGVSAMIDSHAAGVLASDPAVLAVTPDSKLHFEMANEPALAPMATTSNPTGSTTASNFVRTTNAAAAWAAGRYGQGIGIALIDTGISPMADFGSRVVYGPDLSGEGTLVDTFGHGTAMAGAIAGGGGSSLYQGIAPKATLVSVKVAGRDGSVDVSTVLQAMHWVASYAKQYNIRVVNLSWGIAESQSPVLDPLDYGVERLWKQGIVVVASAGNSGSSAGTIMTPGQDPVIITVGAYDDNANSTTADDYVPLWSSRGPVLNGAIKPDLVAPARKVVTARSHGSLIEAQNPYGLVGTDWIRGSGTSQGAAIVSGLVALLLQQKSTLTPDQVKNLLKSNAKPIANTDIFAQGAGRVMLPNITLTTLLSLPTTQIPLATGLGLIQLSRGSMQLNTSYSGLPVLLTGEVDVRGESWVPLGWTSGPWTGSSWTGATWPASNWSPASWDGSSWHGGTWTGSSWQGTAWTGSTWAGSAWTGSSWHGSSWHGTSWTGSSWHGSSWHGTNWEVAFWGDAPDSGYPLPGEMVLDELTGLLSWPLAIL